MNNMWVYIIVKKLRFGLLFFKQNNLVKYLMQNKAIMLCNQLDLKNKHAFVIKNLQH